MTDTVGFRMQPTELMDATRQLDVLAGRIEQLMTAESANLTVTAPGHDEVSERVTAALNDVHAGFALSTSQGVNEFREVAATLRAHSDHIVAAESDFAV